MAANVVFVRRATKTADILKCHNSVDKMSVAVIFDPQMFNRKRKDSIEAELCKIWKEKTSTNNRLYNATKFRLFDHCFVNGKLQFKLGITCYKDLCGTNLSRNVNRYMSDGAADYNDRYSYLSQTLGKFTDCNKANFNSKIIFGYIILINLFVNMLYAILYNQ